MRIESFHIQGFKSIADVKVEGLSDINVFYGLNDVGKSNIFQALKLWYWLLSTAQSPRQVIPLTQLKAEFGSLLFRLWSSNKIQLSVEITLERQDVLNTDRHPIIPLLESRFVDLKQDKMRVTGEIELQLQSSNQVDYKIKNLWEGGGNFDLHPNDLASVLSRFHIIEATRRFQIEQQKEKGNSLGSIGDHNLKQALFYAYLSSDLQQKRRLEAIKHLLAEHPFSLGELDVALDSVTGQIDIGFVRPDGRLPLENLGAGSQQLLLVLGQIFLNDYPIIAVEEPEMNLSPQYQQYLLVALRQLMQDSAVKLNQLFISTHSPYFEFEENFFDVTIDEHRATQVTRLPIERRDRYFPDTQVGPETGARLNSLNQVKLYDGVIKDLELRRGDLVLFVKNEAGRWEIRPEDEIIQELDEIFDREKK